MPWIYLLVGLAALALALVSKSTVLTVLALLAALALFVLWILGLLANRVEAGSRDVSIILDPMELQRLREQAEARRLAQAANREPSSAPPAE
jgi:hypothetical protein